MRVLMMVLVLLLLPPGGARAQSLQLGEYPQIQTHYGLLSVTKAPDGFFSHLRLQGYAQPLHEDRWITILGAFYTPGETANWVLIESNHGGNMCPTSFLIIRIEQGRLDRSKPFGGCLGRIEDVQLAPGQLSVQMGDPDLRVAAQRFSYDGAVLREQKIPAPANTAAPAGAGAQVTRWINQHPSAPFSDASERARFATILSLDDMNALADATSVANRTELRGDWLFGPGCMPHQCNARAGFWALRVSDGAVVAGIFQRGGAHRFFGAPAHLADPVVRAFIAEKALK